MQRAREQMTLIASGAVSLVVIGTVGYWLLFRWSVVESLYMTVITLTTVGYGEVRPLGTGGRLFSIALILLGVSLAAYSASVVGQFMVDGTIARMVRRKRMNRHIAGLRGHTIVAGYGRTGREVVSFLAARKIPFVVVDKDPAVVAEMEEKQIPVVHGNAHDNEALELAGIGTARAVIACATSDAENVFVALTARAIRADLPIACRCEQRESEPKLRKAGATHVINPYAVAGRYLVGSVYRPGFLEFLESAALPREESDFSEIMVDPDSPGAGRTLAEIGMREEYHVSILAVRRHGGEVVADPDGSTRLEPLDVVLALGPVERLEHLRKFLETHG